MPFDGSGPTANVQASNALSELRALKRCGFSGRGDRVQELLRSLDDVLDLDVAGAMLKGAEQHRQLTSAGGFREQRIALLGSSTLDTLPNLLNAALLRHGIAAQIELAGFNQWRFEIMAGAPSFTDLTPRIVGCLLDDDAVFGEIADPVDIVEVANRCAAFPAKLGQWVNLCQQALGGLVVLCTIPLSPLRRDRFIHYRNKARLEAAWHRMNAAILELADQKPRTIVLSAAAIATTATTTFTSDRMRHVAGYAYSPEFLQAYAEELARVARADLGLAKKALILDLDDTLWGGVVGDDGISALRLGGAYPGSAYQELQRLARDLMTQGVMLAICSKNDEAVALEALTTHPEMVLTQDSFVAIQANWNPKPDNMRVITERLNLGVDATVFVDDNPAERGLMRQLLPDVTTVDLPADPAGYATQLAARGEFNLLELTEEDRNRTKLYQARSQRAELEHSADSVEEFLADLGSTLRIESLGPLNVSRIAQLFGKTNQFNMSGRRYSEDDIARCQAEGTSAFFGARLTDRFGDNGLISAVALNRNNDTWSIDNLVLSCRVFSRNVEHAIVGLILRAARTTATAVAACFVETPKNQKFAHFYPDLGFEEIGGENPRIYRRGLQDLPALPRWIRLVHNEEVFHVVR